MAADNWVEEAAKAARKCKVPKVPGDVAPVGRLKHEAKKAFSDSLLKKTLPELRDLLERQNNILNSKKLCDKLPDKGAKIIEKRHKIEELIQSRTTAIVEATDLMAGLKIGSSTKPLVDCEEFEWKHGGSIFKHLDLPPSNSSSQKTRELDSDDDSDNESSNNPLKMLAARELPNPPKSNRTRTLSSTSSTDSWKEHNRTRFAPFNSVKHPELSQQDKDKIALKHTDNHQDIKNRTVEVMPLPPRNYSELKVKVIAPLRNTDDE